MLHQNDRNVVQKTYALKKTENVPLFIVNIILGGLK